MCATRFLRCAMPGLILQEGFILMRFKRLSYYSYGSEVYPGVMKKIDNTVKAAKNLGIEAEHKVFKSREIITSMKSLFLDRSDFIFIRFSFLVHTFLFPVLCYKRVMGAKIVIDVPTPRYIVINEMRGSQSKNLKVKILWSYLFSSWIMFPANKIIQYADESPFFSFGLKHKTLKMGNGVFVDETVKLVELSSRPNELNLIGVASLAYWHGYDRIIKAIDMVVKKNQEHQIKLKIVGDGEVLDDLKSLVRELGLQDFVKFTGALYGGELEKEYEFMSLGVSSLGLYRKGLNEASDLKTREYMAKGLCVLGVGHDPDFASECKYRFVVPNDDSIEPIVEVLEELILKKLPTPQEVRAFAEKYLSYEPKLSRMLNGI